jgi:N-acetylmuramoyl-L-alanine amidase
MARQSNNARESPVAVRAAAALVACLAGISAATAAAAQCNKAAFHTFLDVGHTPQSAGAISARGVTEFDFNLRLGQRMERELRARGFEKTTLFVSRGEARPSLVTRVAKANLAKADLFISIHHDSVPEGFIERWEYLGAEGRFSDRFKGHSIFVSAEHPRYARSLAFGRALGLALKENGLAYTPHYTEKIMGPRRRTLVDKEAGVYRFDKLAVLTLTAMPAVLFEAGSIINRDEELLMESPERQAAIADAVADAVERFCTPPPRTRRPGSKS